MLKQFQGTEKQVECPQIEIDLEKERISLGIKQLTEDPYAGEAEKVRKGDVVTCTITAVVEQGLEVRVGENLSGFIRRADLSRERGEQRTERFAVDEKIDAVITQVDRKTHNLTLSIKAREVEEEKKAMADFGSSDSGASLGDILSAAMAKKDDGSEQRFVLGLSIDNSSPLSLLSTSSKHRQDRTSGRCFFISFCCH